MELKRGSGYNKRLGGRLRLVDKGRQSRVGLEPGEVRAESYLLMERAGSGREEGVSWRILLAPPTKSLIF